MDKQCTAIRRDGTPCQNRPLKGGDRCRWHQEYEQVPSFSFTWTVTPDLFQFILQRVDAGEYGQEHGADTLVVKPRLDDYYLHYSPEDAEEYHDPVPPDAHAMSVNIPVTFHKDPTTPDAITFLLGKSRFVIGPQPFTIDEAQHTLSLAVDKRNRAYGLRLPAMLPSEVTEGTTLYPRPEMEALLGVAEEPPQRPPRPESIPQYTFHEARTMAIAIADARSGRRWEQIEGEIAVRHVIPGEPLQTKFAVGPLANWWGSPLTHDGLLQELRKMEFTGVLLYHVGLHMVLQQRTVSVSIDDLIREIGWEPRSSAQRLEMQRKIWLWLTYFDGMKVIGRRPGRYKDPHSGKELDLTSVDALLRITGTRLPTQRALDGSEVPVEVTFTAGPWLDQYRGNRQVLSDFGNIRNIAAIPAGKPSGAWAQSIGLALYQRWRERATRADVDYQGEESQPTVRVQHFTRRDLLGLFRCEPFVEDVLASKNPSRARQYWDDAIQELKATGVIGQYREVEALPKERQRWQDRWLDQPLDICPALTETQAIQEISYHTGKGGTRKRTGR